MSETAKKLNELSGQLEEDPSKIEDICELMYDNNVKKIVEKYYSEHREMIKDFFAIGFYCGYHVNRDLASK